MSVRRLSKSYISGGRDAAPKSSSFLASYSPAIDEMDLIARVSLSASAASIEFTGIPQTYQHLQIRVVGRSTAVDNNNDLMIQINTDTAANYAWHIIVGTGAAATADALASQSLPYVAYRAFTAANATANIFGSAVIDALDYSSTSKTKVFRTLQGHDRNGAGVVGYTSTLWNSTNAITSIKLTTSAANFAQYSTASIYGVKA